jgi:hypothetical protein
MSLSLGIIELSKRQGSASAKRFVVPCRHHLYVALGLLFLSAPRAGLGQTILSDNLNAYWPGRVYPYVQGSVVSASAWSAQQFHTNAERYILDSITLGFRIDQGISPVPTLELKLYSDAAGRPGQFLAELTPPNMSSGVTEFGTFSGAGVNLAPLSSYWAVFDSPDGVFAWDATDDLLGVGTGFSTNTCFSVDGGTTWTVRETATPNIMQVTATPIPEPATAFLLAATALGLLIARSCAPKPVCSRQCSKLTQYQKGIAPCFGFSRR